MGSRIGHGLIGGPKEKTIPCLGPIEHIMDQTAEEDSRIEDMESEVETSEFNLDTISFTVLLH